MQTTHKQQGFSLIELLIVVAIIGIIAAIAVPNLLASRKASNESAAISSIRTISTAQHTFRQTYGNNNAFAPDLTSLRTNGLIIDNVLSTGQKSGYTLTMNVPAGFLSFTAQADPISPGTSGERHFFTDESGVIRYNASAPAGANDTPIQ